jgi:hypothetical protein
VNLFYEEIIKQAGAGFDNEYMIILCQNLQLFLICNYVNKPLINMKKKSDYHLILGN